MGRMLLAMIAMLVTVFGMVGPDVATSERRTYDIVEISKILGCSRNHAYQMARDGVFPTLKLGSKRIVSPRQKFDAWLNGEQQ